MGYEMAEARAEYGDVFDRANAEKFYLSTVYNPKLVDIPPTEPDCHEIDNNDPKSNTANKQLNELAGLSWEEFDAEAIAAVNYERYKTLQDSLSYSNKEGEEKKE